MKKRDLSLVGFVLLGVFTAFCFIPIIYKVSYWKADTPGRGIYTHLWDELVNLFGYWEYGASAIFGILTILFSLIGISALILQFTDKQSTYIKWATFSPAGAFLCYLIQTAVYALGSVPNGEPAGTATSGYYGHWECALGWGGYIAFGLIIAVSVISVLIGLDKVKNPPPVSKSSSVESADVLMKYKDLLDRGIITQEEFDTKKKQLLGM